MSGISGLKVRALRRPSLLTTDAVLADWQEERPPAPAYIRILYLGKVLQDNDTLSSACLLLSPIPPHHPPSLVSANQPFPQNSKSPFIPSPPTSRPRSQRSSTCPCGHVPRQGMIQIRRREKTWTTTSPVVDAAQVVSYASGGWPHRLCDAVTQASASHFPGRPRA